MIIELFLPALIAGLGVALSMGPVGCFVVWRRMAYFGDTLAHGALIGVAFALIIEVPSTLGIIIICLTLALLLLALQKQFLLPTDTLLGILSHTALAIGIITINLTGIQVNLMSFLFGDILAVQQNDLYWIFGMGSVTLLLLRWQWSALITTSLNEELAKVEGVKTDWINFLLMVIMAIVTAVGIKIVGVLLTTALLVIPAATARQMSKSPEQMAVTSALIAASSVIIGLAGSVLIDVPVGPMIVVASSFLFLVSRLTIGLISKRTHQENL